VRYQHPEPSTPRWSDDDLKELKGLCGRLTSYADNFEVLDDDYGNEMLATVLDIGTLVRKYVR
jgi:hypothetical protein